MTYFAAMNEPFLSVAVPAYNCALYLEEAIHSILNQTFTDFELILVNDGSTDDTEKIILSFNDPRIVYAKNEKNMGLVYTLNKALSLSRGKYIARMDGDDISLPDRFRKQVDFFKQHPDVKMLAGTIELMDADGKPTGYWEKERRTITPQQIRRTLPHDNCLAHPTMMGDAALFKQYCYSNKQKNAEDYDLWLRISADGIPIYKLPDTLVRHRIIQTSFTRQRQKNVFWKNAATKRIFVKGRFREGGINVFVLKTLFLSGIDSVKGLLKAVKKIFTKN
jgi:glycosyltransferase involved in cell wall biosynthesis